MSNQLFTPESPAYPVGVTMLRLNLTEHVTRVPVCDGRRGTGSVYLSLSVV